MIAISIHQVILISPEVFTKFGNNPLHIMFCKICVSQVNYLFEFKLFTQFLSISGCYLKNS